MILNQAPFRLKGRKVLLMAEGEFSALGAKTAVCYLRYRGEDVVAVLDSSKHGQTAGHVLGFGGEIPIVSSVSEALELDPKVAVVGIAPRGGQLDTTLRKPITESIEAGLDVVSGLHTFLADDVELVEAAKKSGSRFWDVRYVPETKLVASGRGCETGAKTVLVTGTDCNVGKMTATVELFHEAERRGMNVSWAATGQTGIMLRERGLCIDRVIADFIGGAAEELVNFEGAGKDLVIVEGQGSLVHPGYAGVTLGLMFGVAPDCMVLAHQAGRDHVRRYDDVAMPPVADLVRLHETVMAPVKKSPVVAVALNTADLDTASAEDAVSRLRKETGLPVSDPVRSRGSAILDAIMESLS
ncbi:MAG: DUF1611 domain-containing protein [Candidatus Latescibacterota bacterium]|nr:MAG: DUF1611 domain-containing protein [Candidatus Latescibacterota bacterium]